METLKAMTTTDYLTLALVIITAYYAWATTKILRANESAVNAMKEQTEALLRPYVGLSVVTRPGTTLLILELTNTGKAAAEVVTLKLDRDFHPVKLSGSKNLAEVNAFKQPMTSLASGARMQFLLGLGHEIFSADKEKTPMEFNITATYSFGGKTYTEMHAIDLKPLVGAAAISDPIGSEIEQLRRSMERNGAVAKAMA